MAPVLGTSSAPVSRQNSLNGGSGDAQELSIMPNNAGVMQPEISPASSQRTAAETETANNTAANAGRARFNLDLPASQNLGSASAPTSPRIMQNEPTVSPLFRSDVENPIPLSTSQSRPESSTLAPLGRAETVGADGVRRKDHQHRHRHHHHHSGHNTPVFDPYRGNSPYSWENRPISHQNSRHATPVFSLARPLPTHEQRTAQKAYRNRVRESAGIAGPGAPHHQQHSHGGIREQPALLGPGAIHHGGVPGGSQFAFGSGMSPQGGFSNVQNEQMMAMLRQLLQQTHGDNIAAAVKKEQAEDDVRDEDVAADEKGAGRTRADKTQERTAAAERRSSFGSDSSCSSSSSSSSDDNDSDFPNPWARFRHSMREPFAEFLGTMLLILFGTGVSLQVFLSSDPNVVSSQRGQYLSISFGWGIGVAMGVWVAGGISGGHINPAVTFSLAIFRGFPWRKVPGYVLAQILGSMTAAGINYGLYRRAISIYEGGPNIRTVNGATATASLFATYPLEYVSDANAFFQEFVDSTVLLMVVLAISDSNNASPPDGLNPLVLFLLITGIGAALGMQTAYCINPARDLGPRLVTWFAGYGREVWNFRNNYWVWTPVLATMSGALFGSFLYDLLIYTGSESPLNRKWQFPWQKKKRPEFGPGSKAKMPAGQSEP